MRKPSSATPAAWIAMTQTKLGKAAPEAAQLNGQFERALYSPEPSTDQQLADLRAALRTFKRALR
jgi:hypothetical protein